MFSLSILRKNYIKQSINYCKLMSTSKSLLNINNNNNEMIETNEMTPKLNLNFDDFKSLAIDKRIEAKIKIIIYEYELLRRRDPDIVPSKVTINDMKQLLNCYKVKKSNRIWIDMSFKKRFKLYSLLKKIESNDGLNQMALPVLPYQREKLYSNRMRSAALFGQNLIIDLSFDNYMSSLECKNCAEQLWRIYYNNKHIKNCLSLPFNLSVVNVNLNERTKHFIDMLYPELYSNDSYVNITQKSYLDLFPKEELIYLSPHAEEVMTHYDHNASFIIGGLVDRQKVVVMTYPKAQQENIRSMRLPLDNIVKSQSIQSLDNVITILHDLKNRSLQQNNIDWNQTFRQYLPKYKLKSEGQVAYELMQKQGLDFDDFQDYDSVENINMNCK